MKKNLIAPFRAFEFVCSGSQRKILSSLKDNVDPKHIQLSGSFSSDSNNNSDDINIMKSYYSDELSTSSLFSSSGVQSGGNMDIGRESVDNERDNVVVSNTTDEILSNSEKQMTESSSLHSGQRTVENTVVDSHSSAIKCDFSESRTAYKDDKNHVHSTSNEDSAVSKVTIQNKTHAEPCEQDTTDNVEDSVSGSECSMEKWPALSCPVLEGQPHSPVLAPDWQIKQSPDIVSESYSSDLPDQPQPLTKAGPLQHLAMTVWSESMVNSSQPLKVASSPERSEELDSEKADLFQSSSEDPPEPKDIADSLKHTYREGMSKLGDTSDVLQPSDKAGLFKPLETEDPHNLSDIIGVSQPLAETDPSRPEYTAVLLDTTGPPQPSDTAGPSPPMDTAGPPKPSDTTGPPQLSDTAGPSPPLKTQPFDTAGLTQPFDTAGLTQPFDTAGLTQPFDTAGLTQPFDTAGLTQPFDTAGLTQPFDTAGLTQPFDTAGLTQPCDTAGLTQPFDTAGLTQPCDTASLHKPLDIVSPDFQQTQGVSQCSSLRLGNTSQSGSEESETFLHTDKLDSCDDMKEVFNGFVNYVEQNLRKGKKTSRSAENHSGTFQTRTQDKKVITMKSRTIQREILPPIKELEKEMMDCFRKSCSPKQPASAPSKDRHKDKILKEKAQILLQSYDATVERSFKSQLRKLSVDVDRGKTPGNSSLSTKNTSAEGSYRSLNEKILKSKARQLLMESDKP
ncbi:CSP-like protein, partial [Mya arenaria]